MMLAGHAAALIDNVHLYDQMKEERNVVADVLESSPSGIIAVDQHKKITTFNRRAEEILELKRNGVQGNNTATSSTGSF